MKTKDKIIVEAEGFRDALVDILNFNDWRERGRGEGRPIRRQILSAFMVEAYSGKLSFKEIGEMCGYRSRSRHAIVSYNVRKIKDCLYIEDMEVVPLYKQARTVFREFEFKAQPDKKGAYKAMGLQMTETQYRQVQSESIAKDMSMSEIMREALNSYFAYPDQTETLPITTA